MAKQARLSRKRARAPVGTLPEDRIEQWMRRLEALPWHETARALQPGGLLEVEEPDLQLRDSVRDFCLASFHAAEDATFDVMKPRLELHGAVLDGCRIEEFVGSGGYGMVFRAKDERAHDRIVALKLLPHPLSVGPPDSGEAIPFVRFNPSDITHQTLVTVYRTGVHTEGARRYQWIAMEWLAGARPVTEYVRSQGLKAGDAAALFLHIVDGVAALHAARVVHFDLKPANILVTAKGMPYVVDFGLALDPLRLMPGTHPYYHEDDDWRLACAYDVRALARILWELIEGTVARRADQRLRILDQRACFDRIDSLIHDTLDGVAPPRDACEFGTRLKDGLVRVGAIRGEP